MSPRADFLYNGKENIEEFNLNWLEFGFRSYDPAISRFTGVDPIADDWAIYSPYNYAGNSPIANIDLWGLQPEPIVGRQLHWANKKLLKKEISEEKFLETYRAVGIGGAIGASTIGLAYTAPTWAPHALRGGGSALLFESGASLITNGNLDKIDLFDVGTSTVTGNFWTGVFLGAAVDVNVDGSVSSIGGVIGDEKSVFSIGLDVAAGGFGKVVEGGFLKLANSLNNQGSNLIDAAINLQKSDIELGSTVSATRNHLIGRLKTQGTNLKNVGIFTGRLSAKSADATTPLLQKTHGAVTSDEEKEDQN